MKNLLFLFLAAYLIGCSPTNKLTMSVMEPAPVTLPPDIDEIGIINRSQPTDTSRILEKIDQVFSVEGKKLDEEGARESVNGLSEELNKNPKFEEVKILGSAKLENPGFGVFPGPVSWEKIDEICNKHQLDGLFSLEFYDTDSRIDYSAKKVKVQAPLGLEVPALEHHASINTTIKTGWRIYDNIGRNIIDEYVITENVTTAGKGVNPAKAAAAITGRKEAVNQISNNIGQSYAESILPYKIRVKREYYVKGNDNFEIAKRRAQTGNWNGAAEIWEKETENPDPKIAGRAFYNMAIINEINGNLDEAIEWARKSYEDFGTKLALEYLNILKNRKAKSQILERQQ
jgi:tetratricopeptide (TPR) repeat protein